MKKSLSLKVLLCGAALLALLFAGLAFGYYYSEDFASGSTGWDLGFRYGRGGITRNPTSDATVQASGDGYLRFRGRVNNGDTDYLGTWAGRMALFTTNFTASVTNPFGVEFRRTYARLDSHNDNNNKESHRHMSAMSFWLVNDPNTLDDDNDTEFSSYPGAVVMYEMMRMAYNTNASGEPFSTWGVYQASEQAFDLETATRPDGTTVNIINNTTYTLEWDYDDYWGDNVNPGSGGTANANADNNNPIIVRITHDGSTIRMYINPNPDDDGSNPYPNEFLLVGTAGVDWSDNIKFMVGTESKRTDTEQQDADIDSVLVRSVASSIKAEISPNNIAKGSTNTFQVVVAPTFTANDAGIGEIVILKPAGYESIAWDVSKVQVFSDNGAGTNHGVISGLQAMTYTASVPTADSEAYITASSNRLFIRFRQTSDANNGVISSTTGSSDDDRKIVVAFTLPSPDSGNATGESFTVTADCVKYNGQAYSKWSTTGKMQAAAGDAHSTTFSGNTLTVKRYGNPDSLATISPDLIYIGNNRTVYLYVATTNDNAPPISELRIRVPDGYTVNTSDSTRFSSLYIADDDSHVFATNVSGTNYIYVRYAADSGGLGLPSPGGLDRVTIQVDSTPTGFSGAETNTTWTATAYAAIAGTGGVLCRTNSTYPNRTVTVRTLPPDVSGIVATSIVENSTNYLYNHQNINSVTYTVVNNGGAGNTIKRIRIKLPDCVNGADGIASTVMGAAIINYVPAINGFVIDYDASGKSIASGGSDTITFNLYDTVVPMSGVTNGSITLEADNDNGDGYVSGQEGSGSWSIYWKNPPAAGNSSIAVQNSLSGGSTNIIPTTDVVSTIKVSIVNTGGTSNNIKVAEIELPSQFTNVISAASLKMFNTGTNISISGTTVRISYYSNSIGSLQNTENDTITLQVADNVGLTAAGSDSFTIKVGNTGDFSSVIETGLIPEGGKTVTFRIPDAAATGYVVPVNIDSSSVTNSMTYVVSNSGAYDNYLGEVRIYIPDSIASNLLDAGSTQLASYPGNVSVVTAGETNYVRLLYFGANPLYGGQTDSVTFKMVDHIESETNFYVIAAATNARNEWSTLAVAASKTNRVVIEIPPASASADINPNVYYTRTTMETNLIVLSLSNTGTGGNNITNAVLTFPTAIQYKIISISNDKGCGMVLANVPRTITLHYTNSAALLSGQGDKIYIAFQNDVTTLQNGLSFTGTVNNGQGAVSIGTISGGSLDMNFVEQPGVEISQADSTPNQIYSTDDESTFTYTIHNGQSGGLAVKRALIELPYPFTSDSIVMLPSWPGATIAVVSTNIYAYDGSLINTAGDEKILVSYSANDLDAGSADVISLTVRDVLPFGETNVNWVAWVDYGDGYGFQPAATKSGSSSSIQFVFPDATGNASISPSRVNINNDAVLYSVTVTNTGISGNHIKMVEITLPSLFTNLSGFSSTLAGTVLSNQGNKIYAVYSPATNLLSSGSDVISFTGTDDVSSISNVTVSVRVANSTDVSFYRDAGTISPNSLDLEFYRPDYIAAAFIKPLAPISSSQEDTIFATITTSTLQFTIVNNGAPGNDLEELKIYIPDAVFDPATFGSAASSRIPGSQIVRSGNVVTVFYTNTGEALSANQSDVLTFVINDTVSYSNASSIWQSVSRFSTSGSYYLTNQTATGKTNGIHLQMPQPQASASLNQNEVYTTSRKFGLVLTLSNTGSGSNALKRVLVTVPAAFRGDFTVAAVSNSSATNISYSAGVLTMIYGAKNPGEKDIVYLHLSNSAAITGTHTFSVTVDNNTYTASATEAAVNALVVNTVTPPSGYAEVSSPKDSVYNRLYSTDYQNEVKVYIRNDGTGSSSVGSAIITAPEGFTVSASSGRIASGSVTVSSNIITLDYSGGGSPIGVSESDVVTLQLIAPFFKGSSNVSFQLQIGDINDSALNTNYSSGRLYSGKSWDVAYVHPAPSSEFYISGYSSGTKPSIQVAPTSGIATTNLEVTVANTGASSNVITNLVLTLPDTFTSVSAPASSAGGSCSVSGTVLTIDYSASPLATGASDTLSFTVQHAQSDATNDLLFSVSADNGSLYGQTASDLKSGWFRTMDVKYPPLAVFTGIVNTTSVYTIFTNATLSYKIKNRAQGYSVARVVLTNFYAGVFDSVTFSSSKLSGTPVTNANGTVVLNFDPANMVAFNEIETVNIGLTYNVASTYVTTLTLQAICTMTNAQLGIQTNVTATVLEAIDTDVGNADNQRVRFGPAPFANIKGTVVPKFKVDSQNPGSILPNIVRVEIIGTNNTTVVTTPYEQETGSGTGLVDKSLQTYTDSSDGSYAINYVPEGLYRIRLSAEGFKTVITNITVVSNEVITIPQLTMRNALLDADSANQQIVMDYNDTNTRFVMEQDGLLGQFSLDISVVDMTDPMETDVQTSSVIKNLSATGALGCFSFELFNTAGSLVDGMSLADDATLVLHYTTTGLNLPVGTDWNADDLAIYYWKESTGDWVPIGGVVNATAQTVSAKVNYLHRYYAVLSMSANADAKPIYNVVASPNPFTPGRGGENNSNIKISFSFSSPHTTYTVTIYNLRGRKVREFKRDGSLAQGEVYWNGTGTNGFGLPGGVYIYQIKAGGQVYTGSVLMLK